MTCDTIFEFCLLSFMLLSIPAACMSAPKPVPSCYSEARRLVPDAMNMQPFPDGGVYLCDGLSCGLFTSVNLYDLMHRSQIEKRGGKYEGVCTFELPTGRSVFMEIYIVSLGRLG